RSLSGVQLVGAGLALVEREPTVAVRSIGAGRFRQGRLQTGSNFAPCTCLAGGRTGLLRAPEGLGAG
ncbi:hypothetical protein, partial [Phenylobacterium sp.]|uniref:hypothetical protein n=1 Tax=Phenylobacterium sp. TaxID=1871053 RepID=UPI0025EAE1E2